ncbi:MAG: TonB-dependent siderophore receptor [Bradyrhizobium sp.]
MAAPAPLATATERGTGPVRGTVASRSVTGTKTDTPLLLTPQSISVVTADEIFARGASSLQEALFYTPGVTLGRFGSNSVFDYPVVRGFVVPTYVDGLRTLGDVGTGEVTPKISPYGAERIEVLRGSSSSLYGQTPPGGLVNVVSKRPLPFDQNEVGVRFGSFNRYESFFDVNKYVDPTLQVRFVGSGQLSYTQQDFVQDNRYYLAPSFTFRPTTDTSFTVLATTQRESGKGYQQFVPGAGSAFFNPNGQIPYSRYLGEPSTDTRKVEYNAIGYAFEHRFNDIFQFRQNARIASLEFDRSSVGLSGVGGLAPDFRTVNRRLFVGTQSSKQAAIDSQLQADFATGPVIHKVLAGVDYYDTSTRNNLNLGFGVTPIDLFNPQYGVPQNPVIFPGTDNYITLRQTGVYVQDQAKWDRLLLTLTGRYDTSATNTDEFTGPTFTRERNSATTGRAALSYLLDGGVAPYVSYATNFDPTPGLDRFNNTFKPRTGVTREAGIKYQPFAGALFTAAVFDTDQKNVLTLDPADPDFLTQTGAVNVKGVELEARISVNKELDLVAGYSRLAPRITASNDGTVGNYQPNVALDTASLWAMYTFRTGPLGGLGIGGGVRYVGNSYADAENLFEVPSSTIFDAAISYDFEYLRRDLKGLSARVNVTNIGDTYYVTNCFGSNSCGLGIGRTVLGTLSYRWQ